jgi:hypothetical protein
MSEPLLTWALFDPLTTACAVTENSRSDRIRYVKQVLLHLPPLHRATYVICVSAVLLILKSPFRDIVFLFLAKD